MKLYYAYSRNKKIGSRLISWASGLLLPNMEKVPSHVAILMEFDGVEEKFIAESVMEAGVRIIPYSSWKQINEECYLIPCIQEDRDANDVFSTLTEVWNKKYDKLGILFFAWCFVKHLVFKSKFPKENAWQRDGHYFCTEVAAKLAGYGKHSMTTPAKMCWDMLTQCDKKANS